MNLRFLREMFFLRTKKRESEDPRCAFVHARIASLEAESDRDSTTTTATTVRIEAAATERIETASTVEAAIAK